MPQSARKVVAVRRRRATLANAVECVGSERFAAAFGSRAGEVSMPTGASSAAKRGLAGAARAFAGCALLGLAGCTSSGLGLLPGPSPDIAAAPVPDVQSQPLAGPTVGQTVGTGPVRVGLILPLTQNGQPSS